ncbi:putative mediator of RNA polymerase II transcription subunit 7 isoform X1 [Clytia hemisphaerica]|uniref:putative mediator of RNA polymerase II transcription subunit 7 isoform X1 n=1 Tax=Clytia hemisphaerica TaxID=252671 RepID=UPI0034D728E9|eukprot:TCONS_00028453-protein
MARSPWLDNFFSDDQIKRIDRKKWLQVTKFWKETKDGMICILNDGSHSIYGLLQKNAIGEFEKNSNLEKKYLKGADIVVELGEKSNQEDYCMIIEMFNSIGCGVNSVEDHPFVDIQRLKKINDFFDDVPRSLPKATLQAFEVLSHIQGWPEREMDNSFGYTPMFSQTQTQYSQNFQVFSSSSDQNSQQQTSKKSNQNDTEQNSQPVVSIISGKSNKHVHKDLTQSSQSDLSSSKDNEASNTQNSKEKNIQSNEKEEKTRQTVPSNNNISENKKSDTKSKQNKEQPNRPNVNKDNSLKNKSVAITEALPSAITTTITSRFIGFTDELDKLQSQEYPPIIKKVTLQEDVVNDSVASTDDELLESESEHNFPNKQKGSHDLSRKRNRSNELIDMEVEKDLSKLPQSRATEKNVEKTDNLMETINKRLKLCQICQSKNAKSPCKSVSSQESSPVKQGNKIPGKVLNLCKACDKQIGVLLSPTSSSADKEESPGENNQKQILMKTNNKDGGTSITNVQEIKRTENIIENESDSETETETESEEEGCIHDPTRQCFSCYIHSTAFTPLPKLLVEFSKRGCVCNKQMVS